MSIAGNIQPNSQFVLPIDRETAVTPSQIPDTVRNIYIKPPIKHTYCRRVRAPMQQVLGEELPIFGTNPISEDTIRSVTRSVAARKRKEAPETPITVKNLRRSSRLEQINNGHRSRSSSDPVSSNTRAAKKKVANSHPLLAIYSFLPRFCQMIFLA